MDQHEAQANSEKNLKTIVSKSWEDEAFKHELISNPVQAIEQLFDKHLDLKGKKVIVTDQTDPSVFYINIPVNQEDMALTETELEAVAGGVALELFWSLICFP